MTKLFLGIFFSCLISGLIQSVSSSFSASKNCLICNSEVLCGRIGSTRLDCPNELRERESLGLKLRDGLKQSHGKRCNEKCPLCLAREASLCTSEQEEACEDIFPQTVKKVCDRPGVFPDKDSPDGYYRCWLSADSKGLLTESIKCPENTVFDSQALLCLNEDERKVVKRMQMFLPPRWSQNSQISCVEPGYYGYPQDCKRYYYCNDELKAETLYCPFGTYYNYKMKNCTSELTPLCKSQLNKMARIQRLYTIRLLTKIKMTSKNNIPPGTCMKFCENNWSIISDIKPKDDEIQKKTANVTYKVSLELLNKYEHTVLQLKGMIRNITEEERQEIKNKDAPKPRLGGFFLRLVIKLLLKVIREVRSYLRQYIRERICPYIYNAPAPDENVKNIPYGGSQSIFSYETKKQPNSHSIKKKITSTTLPGSANKKQHNHKIPEIYHPTTSKPDAYYNNGFPEYSDSNEAKGIKDSTISSEPFDSSAETGEVGSPNSSEFSDTSAETGKIHSIISSEPSDNSAETGIMGSPNSSEFSDSKLETDPDSLSSSEASDSHAGFGMGSHTSSEPSDSDLETDPDSLSSSEASDSHAGFGMGSHTSSEPSDSDLETDPDSLSSSEASDSHAGFGMDLPTSPKLSDSDLETDPDALSSSEASDSHAGFGMGLPTSPKLSDSDLETDPDSLSSSEASDSHAGFGMNLPTSPELSDSNAELGMGSHTSSEPSDSSLETDTDSLSSSEASNSHSGFGMSSPISSESSGSNGKFGMGSPISSEPSDSNGKFGMGSPISSEPSDSDSELGMDSPTSSEPSGSKGKFGMGPPISSEPSDSDSELGMDSPISSEPSSSNGKFGMGSPISSEPSDSDSELEMDSPISSEPSGSNGKFGMGSPISSEPSDSNGKFGMGSPISSEPSDSDSELGMDSPTSSEPSDSIAGLGMGSPNAPKPNTDTLETISSNSSEHSNPKTAEFDNKTSLKPSKFNLESARINSTTPLEPSDSITATTGFNSVTPLHHFDTSTERMEFSNSLKSSNSSIQPLKVKPNHSQNIDISSTSKHLNSSTEKNHPVSVTESSTKKKHTRSHSSHKASYSNTEAEEYKVNKTLSPFCSINETESSDSSAQLYSQSTSDTEPARRDTTLETSDIPTEKERTTSSATGETLDSSTEKVEFHLPAPPTNDMEFISSKMKKNKSDAANRSDLIHSTQEATIFNSSTSRTSEMLEATDLEEENNANEDQSDPENSIENLLNKNKSFKCPHVGVFRDPDDCHSYYRCTRKEVPAVDCPGCTGKRYSIIANHHTCRSGKYFSTNLWKCVKAKPIMCP